MASNLHQRLQMTVAGITLNALVQGLAYGAWIAWTSVSLPQKDPNKFLSDVFFLGSVWMKQLKI